MENGWVQNNGLSEFLPGTSVYIHCDEGFIIADISMEQETVQMQCGYDGAWHTAQDGEELPRCIGMLFRNFDCNSDDHVQYTRTL